MSAHRPANETEAKAFRLAVQQRDSESLQRLFHDREYSLVVWKDEMEKLSQHDQDWVINHYRPGS